MPLPPEQISKVAVVGAGLMGVGIAVDFARFGFQINLYNTNEESSKRAMARAKQELAIMAEGNLLSLEGAKAAYGRLHPFVDLASAVEGANYVIESVLDQLSLKQEIFLKLDECCPPSTILATNTSGLKISDVAAKCKHRGRILGTHYFHPPHLLPLTEVVGGLDTDPDVVDGVCDFLKKLHRKVVRIKFDSKSLVGNRLQQALLKEAQAIVEEGLVEKLEDVDDIILFGFGRRMPYTALFKRMDLIGLDFVNAVAIASGRTPWDPIAEQVKRGNYGIRTKKGLYDWPGDTAEKFLQNFSLELIRFLKIDSETGRT